MFKRAIAWVLLLLFVCLGLLACSDGTGSKSAPLATETGALTVVLAHDFENGTNQGFIPRGPVTLTNTTEAAADGTRSLKTTGRTAGFHGPSLPVTSVLTRGATYEISVKARLVGGELPTTLRLTMQQTPTGGSQQFITVAQVTNATDGAWVTLTGNFSYNVEMSSLLLYVEATTPTTSFYIDSFSVTETAAVNLLYDFENGTNQGFIPRGSVTLTNTTEAAADGLRSLKTTGRTAGFHGPSLNLFGVLRKGATYQVSVRARLVAAEPATTLRVTVQRSPVGAGTAFDSVANASVTDAAFVTLSGIYSFSTDVTALLLYVEAASPTASYYIDGFTLTELAPPPGPPGNTTGAVASFESGGPEGWFARTGTETLTVTEADAHTGTKSLLTSGRQAAFRGPGFNVTNVMFNGSRYRITAWAKLAPNEPDAELRVSLERRLGSNPATFHTVIGNTTVTANAWVRLAGTFDLALANTALTLYVESNAGTSPFYLDDVEIAFVPPALAERDIPAVGQSLAPFFPVGAAIHAGDLTGEHAFLLTKHFSSVTSENDMKWSALQPSEGSFTYATADAQLAFAKQNSLRMRGHTLVWHQQTPAWVFNDSAGNPLTPTPENKTILLARLENHIRAVVAHFGSDIYAWDVANEVIDPNQSDGFRRSPWFNVIGPEYIERAFQVAREMAPNADLYINDFDTTNPTKRQFLHDLVRDLRMRGIPVDGVGHQMHNNVDFPSSQAIVDTVNLFHALGVKQEVTELDVSVYSNSLPGPIADYFDISAERLVMQGYRYRDFFHAFRQLAGKVSSVTFWGQADDHTWLASSSRTNAPLLFDTSLKKKHAYWGIVDPNQLPGADLTASIAASNASVAAGQSLDYLLTITNAGDEDAASFLPTNDDLPAVKVSFVSALPSGTSFESLSVPPGWQCTTPAPGGTGQVACTLDSLDVNASEAFTLGVRAGCAAPDASELTSSLTATSTTRDPNLAPNNTVTATVALTNPPPIITLAGSPDMTVECRAGFTDPGATAEDACDGPVNVLVSGVVNTANVGLTTLDYDASDSAGNLAARLSRSVSVVDTTPPVVTLAGADTVTLECLQAFLDPGATAADVCAGDLLASISGAPSLAVPSVSLLTYSATDPSGNTGAATRTVVRRDTIAPTFDAQDLTVLLPGVKIVLNGGMLRINGQTFPLTGQTLTVLGQTISFGGDTITINGQVFSLDGRTVVLLLPLGQYQAFTIADFIAALGADCDTSLDLGDVVIDQVTSDELDNAPGNSDGNTTNDIDLSGDCRTLRLRAERDNSGNGRVYTVTLRVRDASGNLTARSLKVIVPRTQGTGSGVDDGAKSTVTGSCP
jgi:endo-1,4-beta-xylanase